MFETIFSAKGEVTIDSGTSQGHKIQKLILKEV